jgi:hypothetical protein
MLIDRRFRHAAGFLVTAAVCSLFGVIHSPLLGSPMTMPWKIPTETLPFAAVAHTPLVMASAYAAAAFTVFAGGCWFARRSGSV